MDNVNYNVEEEEKYFAKENLKLYDILETRNGNIYLVLWHDGLVLFNTITGKYLSLNGFDNDLYYNDNVDFDILKIKSPNFWTDAFKFTGMCLDCSRMTIAWDSERENEEVEMTLRDLYRLLGYRVKIIE